MLRHLIRVRCRERSEDVHVDLRKQVLEQAEALDDEILGQIAKDVVLRTRVSPLQAEQCARPYLLLRFTIFATCIGVIAAVIWTALALNLRLNLNTWSELLDLGAKGCQMLVALPLILSFLLLEPRLKRFRVLKAIGELERLNDQVYEAQFTRNAHTAADKEQLLDYLDCCCGLLFLIRVAAGEFARHSSDRLILDRIANIRRGSNDNHRNVLMKIAMTMNKLEPSIA